MGHHRRKEREDEREREQYEEDYFVRIGTRKRSHTEGMTETIDDLLDFGDLGGLTGRQGRGNQGDKVRNLGMRDSVFVSLEIRD